MFMTSSTASSVWEGIPRVRQTPLYRHGISQFLRKRAEILHGLQVNVEDRPSTCRIHPATLALECDATSTPLSRLYSQRKSTQQFVKFQASVSSRRQSYPNFLRLG